MYRVWTILFILGCLALIGGIFACFHLRVFERIPLVWQVVIVGAMLVDFGLLLVLGWKVVADTRRRGGNWGINSSRPACPQCGCPAPLARFPRNMRQFLWGGCTCAACGTEYDKWGKAVVDATI